MKISRLELAAILNLWPWEVWDCRDIEMHIGAVSFQREHAPDIREFLSVNA